MISFNFDLQRFDAIVEEDSSPVLNSIYNVSDTGSKYVMPFGDRSGFGIIYKQRIYFSGYNRYNRFGFGWSDRNSDRNLMYKLPLKDPSTGKELAIAAAAMNQYGTVILTVDRRIFVVGKNKDYCLCGDVKGLNETIKEITEVKPDYERGHGLGDYVTPEDVAKINNVYMGKNFTLFTTDTGKVLGLGRKLYWDDVAPATYTYAKAFCNIKQVKGVSKIAIGNKTVFLLKTNGDLYVFSKNMEMVNDTAVTEYRNSNGQRYYKLLSNIVDIDCDSKRAVAVDKDGKVYCCGNFGCFDPWDGNTSKRVGAMSRCNPFKNYKVKKARIYGHGILCLVGNKVYAIGANHNGRLIPSISDKKITTPSLITYRLGTEHGNNHGIRDIKTFYNTPNHHPGSIFFSCKCTNEKIWVYGLGYGSESGRDVFSTDEDDLNFGYAYDSTTKIFGIHDALFIARPDGVYAAGKNTHGELGIGATEGVQSVFVKVFDEQVEKIAIGQHCCLIKSHGAAFGAGSIKGGAINTPYFAPIAIGTRTSRVTDVSVADFNGYSIPIIQKGDNVYAAGRNIYQFIDQTKSSNSNIKTFTKVNMLNNSIPIEFYENANRRGGLFYKTKQKRIVCMGISEFYAGLRTDELKHHHWGNTVSTQTIAFPEINGEITHVAHIKYNSNTTVVTYNEGKVKGKVKIYIGYCKNAGVYSVKSYDENAINNGWCVIDSKLTGVAKAIPGNKFIAYLMSNGRVYVSGRNPSVKAYCNRSNSGEVLVTNENISGNPPLTDIVDIQVLDQGIAMLQYTNGVYKVFLYGWFTDGTGGTGTLASYINLKEPIAYLSRDWKDDMLIEAGRHMTFMAMTTNDVTKLYALGHNYTGGLGQGDKSYSTFDTTVNDRAPSVEVSLSKSTGSLRIVSIVASDYRTHRAYIIYEDGVVYATGKNEYGELGVGDTTDRRTFTQVVFHDKNGDPDYNVKCIKVVTGNYHTLFLSEDGNVYGCGRSRYGVFGNGLTIEKKILNPILIAGAEETKITSDSQEISLDLGDGTDIVDIAAGDTCSYLLDSNGYIYMAGSNEGGGFGNGAATTVRYNHFTKNDKVNNAIAIYAAADASYYVSNDYILYGGGKYLAQDDSSSITRLTYRQCKVVAPYDAHDFMDTFSTGESHAGFILSHDCPHLYGKNEDGRLGVVNVNRKHVTHPELNNAIKISCGWNHTLILTSNGLVYSFGSDSHHQLGRSTTYSARDKRKTPGYVFSLFPYVIGNVDDDTGTFVSANGKTYQYKFIYSLENYSASSCTYTIQVAVGCDIDEETNSVDYAYYTFYPDDFNTFRTKKKFTFTRFQTNTIDDDLYNAAMTLLGKKTNGAYPSYSVIYKINQSVYELEDIQCIDSKYFKDGLGCYYYRIEAEIGDYTPHESTSAVITISLVYYVKSGAYDSTYKPTKYNKTYSIPSDLTSSITVRGGANCTSDYKSVHDAMVAIQKNFINWIKNTPVPMQCRFTVNKSGTYNINTGSARTYTAAATGKQFSCTFGCSFDGNNYPESLNTTMTVTYTLRCTTDNTNCDFTYTGSRSFIFTYYNRSEAQAQFDAKVYNIENTHKENGKWISGIKTYIEKYIGKIYSALNTNSTIGQTVYLSPYESQQGIKYDIIKYDKVESNNSVTYGIYVRIPASTSYVPSGENDARNIVKAATLTFNNNGVASWTYTKGNALIYYNYTVVNGKNVDYLASKAVTRNIRINLGNYKTYQNSINTELNTLVTDLQNSLKQAVGLIYEPSGPATFTYSPGNGERYTIRGTIDVNNNYRPFTDTSVSVIVKVEMMPSTRQYYTVYQQKTYYIVGKSNPNSSKNEVGFATHRADLLSALNSMVTACKTKLSKVIPSHWGFEAECSTDSTYDGFFYFLVKSKPANGFVPYETESIKYNTSLTYGRAYRNWPTNYNAIDNASITVTGTTFLANISSVQSAFNAARQKFITAKNPTPPTQLPIPDYYQIYTHKEAGDNGYIYAVYRFRIYYDIEQDPKNKYSYNTYHNLYYAVSSRNTRVDDFYNRNPIWYKRCRALKVINKNNYTQYPGNVTNYGESHKDRLITEIQSFLSSKLISVQPDDYDGNIAMVLTTGKDIFNFPNVVIYCEKTRLLFDIKFETTLTWNGKCPENSTLLKTTYGLKWSYRNENSFKDNLIGKSTIYTNISTYHTYKARATKTVSDMLDAANNILETFIGPIILPSIAKEGYTASTGHIYYIRHKFEITMPNNDYTKATVTVEEEWDNIDSFNNHRAAWGTKKSIVITAKNYTSHTLLIEEMAVELRNSFKANYLNNLVPPVEDNYPDLYGTISVAGTGTVYEYYFTYTVIANTDYTYKGTARIGYSIEWKDISKNMERRTYGQLQTYINKDNYIVRKSKLDELKDTCIKTLQAYCDSLVPPLEDQGDLVETYQCSITGWTYELTTKFNIITNTDYTKDGSIKVSIVTSAISKSDDVAIGTTSKQSQTFTKTNFKDRTNLLRKVRAGETTASLITYLDTLVPPLELDDFHNYEESGIKYRCNNTSTLYYIKTIYTLNGRNSNYSKNDKRTINITSWYGLNNTSYGYKYGTTASYEININTFKDRYTEVRNAGAANRESLKTYLDSVLPPVTVVPTTTPVYFTHACVATNKRYAGILTYAVTTANTDYKHNGKAVITATVSWDTDENSSTYSRSFSTKKTHTITCTNYNSARVDVEGIGTELRNELGAYLDTLTPPLEDVPDRKYPYVAETTASYYKLVDYTITTQTNYHANQKGKITVTPKWGVKEDNYNHTVLDLVQTLDISLSNYSEHVNLAKTLLKNVEKQLNGYLDTLLGPIDTVPDIYTEFKTHTTNGLAYAFKITFSGDSYAKYESEGVHDITLSAKWKATQNLTTNKYNSGWVSYTVPDKYKTFTVTLANYYDYTNLATQVGLNLIKEMEKYIGTLIGHIVLPKRETVTFVSTIGLTYYLRTTYEIEDKYTQFGVYNEENTEGKYVLVNITTVCGETKNFELGEYVDQTDPDDADYLYDKEFKVFNSVFSDHTDRISSIGEAQREQICKKLENRIGVTILPGTPIDYGIDENGRDAVLKSEEVIPDVIADSTGIRYYVKTIYTKLTDDSDVYDNIKIETVWCKTTDALNSSSKPAYARKYPDHLSSSDISLTYDIFQITAKNYPNHTELLMGIGANQRSHPNDYSNAANAIGLYEYLETLIGMVAVYNSSTKKYATFAGTNVTKAMLSNCIVVPEPSEFVYYSKSGKLFYTKTTYTYAGSAGTNVDADETSCSVNYVTIYGPNENYSNATQFATVGTHVITVDNFKTREEDLLECGNSHFRTISRLFGIWDVEVPNTEIHQFANKGGIVWYIKIAYSQGATTNTSNTIKYDILYSRDKEVPDSTAILYGSYTYTITADNFQGTDETAEAIVNEANTYRLVLEEGLYIPQILMEEPATDPHIPYTVIRQSEEAEYTCNDFHYLIKVEFSKRSDLQTEIVEAGTIFVRDYIDGVQYGSTVKQSYTRTVEEAAQGMDDLYSEHIRILQAICDKSPSTKKETISKYNFSFEIVGSFSKEAGNGEVVVSTQVDGINFYFGADTVQRKYLEDFTVVSEWVTYSHLTENGFLNFLDDAVSVFNTYALHLRRMIQDLPFTRSDSFTHSIETENYSVFTVSYNKKAGNPNYDLSITCDSLPITDYTSKEMVMFSSTGINSQVFIPNDIVSRDTIASLESIKSTLNATHKYYATTIRNLDGLGFGFRYTITKDSNSNIAILSIYVDEVLYREFEKNYTYNHLAEDRAEIYNTVEQEIDNIKTKIYYAEIDDTITVPDDDGYTGSATGGVDSNPLPEGATASTNPAGEYTPEKETRLKFMTGILDSYNGTGFSYSYSVDFEKDPNDRNLRMTFVLDNHTYKTYTHTVDVDSYDKDINEINDVVQSYYDNLLGMLAYNPKNNETTPYYVEGFDYTCGATYLKLSGNEEVIINILVDGIIEQTLTDRIQTHYGEVSQQAIYTPLDDINRIITKAEQAIFAKIATFRGLTKDLVVYTKNGFSFNLSTVYSKNITNHTITMKSYIDSHQYGSTITEELTEITRQLIDDSNHSSQTYHGRGLSVIEDMKLALQDLPEDTYRDFTMYGFKFNIGVKYTKTKGADEIFITKILDSVALSDYSTMTFSVSNIDNINTLGISLLSDMESYFRNYCPANNEYVYVPTGTDLPFVIRTIYNKEKNSNNVYITTSLDGATYGATSVKTFDINNISELRSDVDYKETLLKKQLEKGPKDHSEEYTVKNCVFKIDIKYSKAQDNLNINSSLYLDDVRYGEVRTERFDMTNPGSVTEYPNQMLAQLKSLLADTIPEDIISTYSRGKYTFDMEITFTKSSGSDVVTITYKINSADVYSTSLSTGALISG